MPFNLLCLLLSVLIINYNVKLLLEQCLLSITAAGRGIDYEVLVADNASADGSVPYLEGRFANTTFYPLKENIGFARANNLLLAKACGKYILFLNPDTQVPEDCFRKCLHFAEKRFAAFGVRMVDAGNRFLRESKRCTPTVWNSFCKISGLSALFPNLKKVNGYYAAHLNEFESGEIDILSGAFFWVPAAILKITGGFDERFFMYGEDIDLSMRIKKAGFRVFYFGKTTIVHVKGASTPRDERYIKNFYGAMELYVQKYYPRPLAGLLRKAIQLRALLALIWLRLVTKKKPE